MTSFYTENIRYDHDLIMFEISPLKFRRANCHSKSWRTKIHGRVSHATRVLEQIALVERRIAAEKQASDDFLQDIHERTEEVQKEIQWLAKQNAASQVAGNVLDIDVVVNGSHGTHDQVSTKTTSFKKKSYVCQTCAARLFPRSVT